MINYRLSLICLLCSLLFACNEKKTGAYNLFYVTPGGKGPQWESCETISRLTAPWEENRKDSTVFQACYDSSFLYFRFRTMDSSITVRDSADENEVATGDRVELFFSGDTTLKDYYCIEMAPGGRVLDYRASYYRKFDNRWNVEGLSIQSSQTGEGYSVTGRIPLRFFIELTGYNVQRGKSFVYFGIFRADKNPGKDFTWYSWIKPAADKPDFHIPSAFGKLIF